MITSVKMSATVSAISTLTVGVGRDHPAERGLSGSHSWALRWASATEYRRDRDPTRVGVLDYRHADLFVVERGTPRRVGIGEVVVGHLFSVQLLGLRQTRPRRAVGVDRGLLMRVLAVAQHGLRAARCRRPLRQRAGPDRSGASTAPIQDATATSYSAVCRNANDANFFRSSRVNPPARPRPARRRSRAGRRPPRRWDGSWRRRAPSTGPPMSICSTHSSSPAPEPLSR